MKKQIQRKDKTLIKADLVAILVHLRPELLQSIEGLERYTVSQLNAMVRATVYDPERILMLEHGTSCHLTLSASSPARICTA